MACSNDFDMESCAKVAQYVCCMCIQVAYAAYADARACSLGFYDSNTALCTSNMLSILYMCLWHRDIRAQIDLC